MNLQLRVNILLAINRLNKDKCSKSSNDYMK